MREGGIEMQEMRSVDPAGNDSDAQNRAMGGEGNNGRDVHAPRADTAMDRMKEAGKAHELDIRAATDAMFQIATDHIGNVDSAALANNIANGPVYDRYVEIGGPNIYENPGDAFELGDPDVDVDDRRAANDANLVNGEAERQGKIPQQVRAEILEALGLRHIEANRHAKEMAKDLKTAVAEYDKAVKGRKTAQILAGLIAVLGSLATLGTGITIYLLATRPKNSNPNENTAFDVEDDALEGLKFGSTAKVNVLDNDANVDASTLALEDAVNGKIDVATVGIWSIADAQVVFDPAADYYGDPDPVTYTVKSVDGTQSGAGIVTLLYNGEFKIKSPVQTTFKMGQSMDVPFLEGSIGADAQSAKLIANGHTLNSDATVLTVTGEGVWTLDRGKKIITFDPDPTFVDNPSAIEFSVENTAKTRTLMGTILLIDESTPGALDSRPKVPNILKKSELGKGFSVAGIRAATLVVNQQTLKIEKDDNTQATSLNVTNEGNWTIDANGELAFKPDSLFKGLPSPIKLSIEDMLGVRSLPFFLTIYPYAPPHAFNEFPTPEFDMGTPGVVIALKRDENKPVHILRGDFDVDYSSVRILGPMPFDGALPSARFDVPGKKLTVDGEGTWNVENDGSISCTISSNATRWPTPIAYTIKDIEGNESNVALIWIDPNNNQIDLAIQGTRPGDDDLFWTSYKGNILTQAYTLPEILIITTMLERFAMQRIQNFGITILDGTIIPEQTINDKVIEWGVTNKASPPKLEESSAFIDLAYARTLNTRIDDRPEMVRVLRLRFIMTLIRKVIDG